MRGEDTPIEERITIEPADRPAKKARAGSEGAEEEEEDEGAAGARAAQLSRTKVSVDEGTGDEGFFWLYVPQRQTLASHD